jgi:hypothetical protein
VDKAICACERLQTDTHDTTPSTSTKQNVKLSFFAFMTFAKHNFFLQLVQIPYLHLNTSAFQVKPETKSLAANVLNI